MLVIIAKIGALVVDCEINHAITGEIDPKIPGHLNLKDKVSLIKGKEKGRNMTHKIIFTSKHMGKKYTQKQIEDKEWELYDKSGSTPTERYNSPSRTYEVNPYQYARTIYEVYTDADQLVDKSLGASQERKLRAFNILKDPAVAPFTDQMEVADSVIEEFGGELTDDPEKLKKKDNGQQNSMLNSIMGAGGKPQLPNGGSPVSSPQNNQPAMVQ